MASEKFCLKWNDFESNISVAFRELREDKDFFDVTIACDDEQISAHKVILSACSPFFRNILRRNNHQHPLLYLKGVNYSSIQSVLNFMYHGEVNVAQEDLNSFLAVAEDLKVKGLTQNQDRDKTSSSVKRPRSPPKVQRPSDSNLFQSKHSKQSQQLRSIQSESSSRADDDDIQEVLPVKTEPRDTTNIMTTQTMHSANQIYHGGNSVESTSHDEAHSLAQVEDQNLEYADPNEQYDYGQFDGDQNYEGAIGMMPQTDGNKGNFYAFLIFFIFVQPS